MTKRRLSERGYDRRGVWRIFRPEKLGVFLIWKLTFFICGDAGEGFTLRNENSNEGIIYAGSFDMKENNFQQSIM